MVVNIFVPLKSILDDYHILNRSIHRRDPVAGVYAAFCAEEISAVGSREDSDKWGTNAHRLGGKLFVVNAGQ